MIVDLNSGLWVEPWFLDLSLTEKVLYCYLYANDHKNLIGLYRLSIKIISVETGIPEEDIHVAIRALYPKVQHDREANVIWVVEHFREQFLKRGFNGQPKLSDTIVKRAVRDILSMHPHPFIEAFLKRYPVLEHYYGGIEIPQEEDPF